MTVHQSGVWQWPLAATPPSNQSYRGAHTVSHRTPSLKINLLGKQKRIFREKQTEGSTICILRKYRHSIVCQTD